MMESIIRSLPYFFIVLVLFVLYVLDKNYTAKNGYHNPTFIKGAYFILLLFYGLRGFVMTDFEYYYPYYEMIDGIDSIPNVIFIKGYEPGFVLYTCLCKMLIPNYFAWNFISTLIDLLILNIFIRRFYSNHILFLIIFFIIGGMNLEMNYLRYAKAFFIFLLALKYIQERKIVKYTLMILLAMSFHTSAIFCFPLYFILLRQWPLWLLWLIFIAGCIILFCHIDIITILFKILPFNFAGEGRLDYYADHYLSNAASYGISLGTIERIVLYLIVLRIYYKYKDRYDYRIFFNMYILMFMVFFYFSTATIIVQRFYLLFAPGLWFVYIFLYQTSNSPKHYHLKYILILLLLLKLFQIGNDPQNRYENLITGISSYEERRMALNRFTGEIEERGQ